MHPFLKLFISLIFLSIAVKAEDSVSVMKLVRGKELSSSMRILDSLTKGYRYSNPELALFCVRKNLVLLEEAPRDSATYYRLNRAVKILREQRLYTEALRIFKIMEEFLPDGGPGMQFEFYNNRGTFYRFISAFDMSTSDYLAGLAIAEKSGNKEWQAILYNNIAGVYFSLERIREAVQNFQKSRDMYKELGNDINAALAEDNMGMGYFKLNEFDNALNMHLHAQKVLQHAGSDHHHSRCVNYSNIALVMKAKALYSESRRFFDLSLACSDSAGTFANYGLIYLNLGDMEMEAGNFIKAEANLRRFITLLTDTLGSDMGLETALGDLAQVYVHLGQKDSALKYMRLYTKMQDSLYTQDIAANIAQYETLYESDKKEHQIEILEKDKKQQRIILYSVIGGLLLFSLLSVLLIRSNAQRKRANQLLEEKNNIIESHNKDITDSINYAKRIQFAFQPSRNALKKIIPDWFILQKPRNIVSGDFFWFSEHRGRVVFAVADCTGHGVPGALMSMVGLNFIEQAVMEQQSPEPSLILNELHKKVVNSLNENVAQRSSMDGMDVALLIFDPKSGTAQFSGAVRTFLRIGKKGPEVFKGDRYSVGGVKDMETPFTQYNLKLEKGDSLYLFSDGYADQFSFTTGKKFMIRKFYQLLETISALPMHEQESTLLRTFEEWKGNIEQTDDVLVVGIRF